MFELGLVVYKNTDSEDEVFGERIKDAFGWIEATPLGELVLAEWKKAAHGS